MPPRLKFSSCSSVRSSQLTYTPPRNKLLRRYITYRYASPFPPYQYDEEGVGAGRLTGKLYFDEESGYLAWAGGQGAADEVVSYTYDAQGRRTTTTEARGVTTYTYNEDGQFAAIASPEGIVGYAYDTFGRHVRTYTEDAETPSTDTRYDYDALGRLSTVTAVALLGEILASPQVTTYSYDAVGNLQTVLLPNDVLTTYVYDDLNRLEFMNHVRDGGSGTLVASYDYVLDASGNRMGVIVVHEDPSDSGSYDTTTIEWTYDAVNRLVSDRMEGQTEELTYETTYTFDLVGNRLTKQTDTDLDGDIDETITYAYDANDRLLSEAKDATYGGGTSDDRYTVYSYDNTQQTGKVVHEGLTAAGDVLEDTQYTYNRQGKLWVATTKLLDAASGNLTSQERTTTLYDASGDRIESRQETDVNLDGDFTDAEDLAAATTTSYLNDAMNPTGYAQILEEVHRNAEGDVTKAIGYVLGHDVITQAVLQTTLAIHHLLYDGHGSTRALLDSNDAFLPGQLYFYDAYGNALNFAPGNALTHLLYSGESFSARLNLQYLRARWYDAATGRFASLDPFAGNANDPQSFHKYLYTHGNPVVGIDPSGLYTTPEIGAGLTIIAVLLVLSHPNVANAPSVGDGTMSDASGDMVTGFYITLVLTPPLVVAGKIVGIGIQKLFALRGPKTVLIPTAQGSVGIPGKQIGGATFVNPGPLSDHVAGTFAGGRYAIVETSEPIVIYRAWGGTGKEFGGFWTTQPPAGSLQAQIDNALLLPKWGTTATNWTAARVPAGTRIFIGEVSTQGGIYVGGGVQLLVENGVKQSWKVATGILH